MDAVAASLMAVAMGVMARRAVLETGIRPYLPARHRLHVRREGVGPPLVLLHGLAGSWRYWRRGFDGLKGVRTVHAPDLIGFGRSPKPRGSYSLDMHTDAVGQVLEDVPGEVVIAGHSMGALIALAAAARFPDRVSRLILIGLPYFPSPLEARRYLARQSTMNGFALERPWLARSMCYMKDALSLPFFAPLAGMPRDLYADYWKHTWNSVYGSLVNTLLAADVVQLLERVERSRILLVHGISDPVVPVAHIRELAGRFPDLRSRELRGGHHLYLMFPRVLNRILTEA
jgi:pimeloyl-ACP methyl ester carboxylesterase